jgi:hypothetical protein
LLLFIIKIFKSVSLWIKLIIFHFIFSFQSFIQFHLSRIKISHFCKQILFAFENIFIPIVEPKAKLVHDAIILFLLCQLLFLILLLELRFKVFLLLTLIIIKLLAPNDLNQRTFSLSLLGLFLLPLLMLLYRFGFLRGLNRT